MKPLVRVPFSSLSREFFLAHATSPLEFPSCASNIISTMKLFLPSLTTSVLSIVPCTWQGQ